MIFSNPLELLLPTSLHLLLLLIVLCVLAFRSTHRPLRRWRFVLAGAVAWVWLVSTPAIAHKLALDLETRYPPVTSADVLRENPVIVVLASGESFEQSTHADRQLDLASFRRTLFAVQLWKRAGGELVFSGAAYSGEREPVSARMARLAHASGVPLENIRVESESLNTFRNLRNVAALIHPRQRIVLVTSAMHLPRAMAVAKAQGLDALAAPCDYRAKFHLTWRAWIPDGGALPLLEWVVHEWAGRAYYAVRGWL